MKTDVLSPDTDKVKSFISDNKVLIAAIGGVTLGLTIASLMGNEKARQILRSAGSSLADMSGKFAENLGGYKNLIAPLLGKSETQGV
jgi:ATP-dependent protease HslVU (ClpYQ) peptidase subunit